MIAALVRWHVSGPNPQEIDCTTILEGFMRILTPAFKPVATMLAFCVLAVSSLAAPKAEKPALKVPELKYVKYTLPNGLVVLTHEDHRLPLVAVDLWYHVGPLNERAGRTGFAHLFEHMMFEGSEHVGEKAHIKYVQGAGATDVNGTTNFDRTNYFETMPSNYLETALWLESDRMGFLLEGLDREKLTNQRDVVRNERRQGEGSPYSMAREESFHLLFPKGHPYYANVIGSHADIEAARINDVRDFHQHFYTPNNASIAIAGDFDPAKLKALLDKYFGPIPAGPKVEAVTSENTPTPPITEQKRATVTDTVKLPLISFSFLTPPAYGPGDAEAETLGTVLGGSAASRLDRELVFKRQVAQQVSCGNRPLKLVSIFGCSIVGKPGVKLEDLEAAFWAEVDKLKAEGPTQDELDAAKTGELTEKIAGLQRFGGFGGVADTLDSYYQYTGDAGYLPRDIARYQALTVASIKDAANKYLGKNQAVVVECVPGKKVVDDVPRSPADTDADAKLTPPYTADFEKAQDWRKTVPQPGPAPEFHLPVPATFALKNGLKVYVTRQADLPIVTMSLVTRAGGEADPSGKPGMAEFTAGMLSEGTEKRTATEIAAEGDRLGTNMSAGAGMDSASANLTVLTTHTDEAFDLLSDVIQHPAFHPEDLERVRKRRMVFIQQEGDSVAAIARRAGLHLIYGDQPYGYPSSGTVASLQGITRDEMQGFWAAHYGPGDSALTLAGDVTEGEARKWAETYFGGWTGKSEGAVKLPAPPAPPTNKVVIIDKPGAPQTALFAYGLGVPESVPNHEAIDLMNYTLGASFGSRINMNLREVHGYTYGASSRYIMYREGGPFIAGGLVKTDVTGPAAAQLMLELKRIQTEPPTEAELKMARDARTQSIPASFETTGSTAGTMGNIFIYDRALDYYAKLPGKLRAVTPEEVLKAAKTDVKPGQLLILAVGDKPKIEPGLKELGYPIEYADPSGNPVQ
jgi:zinc protease